MSHGRWRLSAESITAAAAVVAALIALAVGVWENVQQRRHNRMSVFPSIQYVAELRTDDADSVARGVLRVVNEGVGPAVIDEVQIRLAAPGEPERVFGTWGEAREGLRAWGVNITDHVEIGAGSVMAAGRERDLVAFTFPTADQTLRTAELFARLLERLQVTIVYRSIYGDQHRATLERS